MAPATSTIQAINSSSNNACSMQEGSEGTHAYSDCGGMGHPVALHSIDQKHDRKSGKCVNFLNMNPKLRETKLTHPFAGESSGFTCSHASNWADEELKNRRPEMADGRDATTLDFLCAADSKGEKLAIEAGRKRGMTKTRAFDDAWAAAKGDLYLWK
jgi:hypothetical protein